jgi:hypothetical protein
MAIPPKLLLQATKAMEPGFGSIVHLAVFLSMTARVSGFGQHDNAACILA